MPTVAIPLLTNIPVLGKSIFDQPLIVYIGAVAAVAGSYRTNLGLKLRAAGGKPEALDTAGVNVVVTQWRRS